MILQDSLSVAANATSANVLSGQNGEFVQNPGAMALYATGSAIGLRVTMSVGGQLVIDDQAIGLQNRFPLVPDDFIGGAEGMQGDRIIVRFRNSTAGALTAFWRLEAP